MNQQSKHILLVAALTLTAGLTVSAQVSFNDRVGSVSAHGTAEDNGEKSAYLKQMPAVASGGFAEIEEFGEAKQGSIHVESRGRLTQNLTFDPVNGLPRLVVNGTATALTTAAGELDTGDRGSAFAGVFYRLDFSLSSPQFVQLSGHVDAAAHSGNVQLGFANIVGTKPGQGGFLYGDIGASAFAAHTGIQFQHIGFFETLPAGRYELLAFSSASPRLTKFQFDHGFEELTGKGNFSFTLDFASAPPQGNVIRWIEPAGGVFGQTQNWDPQQVPEKSTSRNDTALFDLPANYTVNVDGTRTVERLVVRDGRVDLNGDRLTVAALSTNMPSVSIENAGRLNIAAGGLKSVHAIIGNAPPQDPANPPTAEVLVTNVVPGWDTTGNLAVGGAGRGRLFVAGGGFVKSGSATIGGLLGGEAIVGGQDSFWNSGNLGIGLTGQGTLTVESGGEVLAGNVVLGDGPGDRGTIIVDGVSNFGVASMLTSNGDGITVGLDGEGTLRVENGGNVRSRKNLSLGNGSIADGSLVVRGFHAGSGQRSTVTVIPIGGIGNLTIGQSLQSTAFTVGRMLIENGALVTSVAGSVGASAPGSAIVRGSGNSMPSEWKITDQLVVGQAATGTLNIESGGLVSTSSVTLGEEPPGGGTITVAGVGMGGVPSTLKNTSSIFVGQNGQGTLRVESGGLVDTHGLAVGIGTGVGSGSLLVKGFDIASGKRSTVSVTPVAGLSGTLTIGTTGPGELLVENGALVTSATGEVGAFAPGTATVRGLGNGMPSEWKITDQLFVGRVATGTLNIESGGLVSTRIVTLAEEPPGGGTITVTGVGMGGVPSTLKNTSSIFVGQNGQGTLRVESGGLVEAHSLAVGIGTGVGSGSLMVKGFDTASGKRSTVSVTPLAGSSGFLTIGTTGPGELLVENGALMTSGTGEVGAFAPGTAIVRGSGNGMPSEWRMTGNLTVGGTSTGTLTIENGGRVQAQSITVGPGSQVLGNGTLAVAPSQRLLNGGSIAPGLSPGTLTVQGNYEQTAGGRLDIEVAGTSAGQFDVLNVTGNATLGGRLRLKFIDGFAPRQGDAFEFLDVGGTLGNSLANVELRNLAPAFQFEVRSAGGAMTMVALNDGVFFPSPPSNWNVNAGGNWSAAANWTIDVPNAAGDVAVFGDKITAPRTVTVNVPVTLGRIAFASAHAYTIGGSHSIILNSQSISEQINVTSGSHTISAPVTLADNTLITVTPAVASLSITGPVSADNVTLIKAGAGTLTIGNLRAAALSIGEGTVAVATGGMDANVPVLGALSIAGGVTPTAKLDLKDNAAIINYAGTSPAATVRQQIVAGRGGSGLGKIWNGQGITSSTAAGANATDAESRSVGYAENSALPLGPYTTFRGQPVDNTSILMAFTRTGDANLDGLINDDDVTIVGASYAPGVPQPSWALGDFDYNGFVDDDDVTLLGAFYDPSASPPAVPAGGANAVAAVPEPGSLMMLVVGLVGIGIFIRVRVGSQALA